MAKLRHNLTKAGWLLMVALYLVIPGYAQPQPSTPSPPPYQPLRYEEDWSYLSDKTKQTGDLDKLKHLPLNGCGWYVSLGGEARMRYEYFSQFNFGAGPQDDDGYLLQRYLLHADAHFGSRVRIFAQLQSGIGSWRDGGPRLTDDDRRRFPGPATDSLVMLRNGGAVTRWRLSTTGSA